MSEVCVTLVPPKAKRVRQDLEDRRSRKTSIRPFRNPERSLTKGLPVYTSKATSERMARVRQRGTAPEVAVISRARTSGFRFTTRNNDLPGSPDLANRSRKFAIFVHGCYWHRHAGCSKTTTPKTNTEFWCRKFNRNVQRDREAVTALRQRGYAVVSIWECETLDTELVDAKLREALKPESVEMKTRSSQP
jgi:DNA mismatch endonuclease (patch repair protein)